MISVSRLSCDGKLSWPSALVYTGFCIHNYWFSGRKVLEKPLDILLSYPDIDLRFCLILGKRYIGRADGMVEIRKYCWSSDTSWAMMRDMQSRFCLHYEIRDIFVSTAALVMLKHPGPLPDAKASVERWRAFFIKEGVGYAMS